MRRTQSFLIAGIVATIGGALGLAFASLVAVASAGTPDATGAFAAPTGARHDTATAEAHAVILARVLRQVDGLRTE